MNDRLGNYPILTSADMPRPKRSVLYWGRPKTGKTHCMLTWPKPFVIYWDDNLSTLLKFKVPFVHTNEKGERLTWEDFEKYILPAIRNRTIDAETIVFDSYSYASQDLRKSMQGSADKMPIAKWGSIMDRLFAATKDMTEACLPDPSDPNKRTYNFIASVHEQPVLGDDGELVKFKAAIQGQFAEWLPRFFDTVLVTDVKIEKQPDPITKVVGNSATYFVHTVSPDKYWIAGDGVGGDLGDKSVEFSPTMPKKLPATLSGTYQSLSKAWGINQQTEKK